jgi:hypothetical protein
MGGRRWFYVESKSFKFVLEESGKTYGLRIYEREMNSMSNIILGRDGAQQLLSRLAKVILHPLDQIL